MNLKSTAVFLLFIGISYFVNAQNEKGQAYINFGAGVGNTQKAAFADATYGTDFKTKTTIPPLFISADFGVTENFSVGGYVNYSQVKTLDEDNDLVYKSTFSIIGVRGLYHFETSSSKFKPYIGAGLGYRNIKLVDYDDEKLTASGIGWNVLVGSKYMFNEKTGAFAELGYGTAILNLGVTIKVK